MSRGAAERYMQGLLNFRSTIAESGKFFASIGDARVSIVDIRDIAAVAAISLTKEGYAGKTYILTGPAALTHAERAENLSSALNQSIAFVTISPAIMRSTLDKIGSPAWQADGLIENYAHYSRNEAIAVSMDIQDTTGRAPRSFAQFAQEYAPAFSTV